MTTSLYDSPAELVCRDFVFQANQCGQDCACKKQIKEVEDRFPGIFAEIQSALVNLDLLDQQAERAAILGVLLVIKRQERSNDELVFDEERPNNRFFSSSEKYDTWADIPQKKPITGPEGYEDGFLEQPPSTMPEGD